MRKIVVFCMLAYMIVLYGTAHADVEAEHKNGQTFLTWNDIASASQYRIYRSFTPVTTSDLIEAKRIAQIDSGSTYIKHFADLNNGKLKAALGTGFFRIQYLGVPLAREQELLVWTFQDSGGGDFYYAITAVTDGREDTILNTMNTVGPVSEQECLMVSPVEQACSEDSSGHVFMFWMPFDKWNKQLEGYAYPIYIAAKKEWKGVKKRLFCDLHGRGDYFSAWIDGAAASIKNSDAIGSEEVKKSNLRIYFDDPYLSWHFGYADSLTNRRRPGSHSIVFNYTEYRNWCAIRWLCSGNAPWIADDNWVCLKGGSMGGSGSFTFAAHHPDIFAYIEAVASVTNGNQSIMNSDGIMWGIDQSLECRDLIDNSRLIGNKAVDLRSNSWANVRDSIIPRIFKNDTVPFYHFSNGTQDGIVSWTEQGAPIWSDHGSNSFARYGMPYAGGWSDNGHEPVYMGHNPCGKVGRNHFVLALKNAASDDTLSAACINALCHDTGQCNARILWSTMENPVVSAPVDSALLLSTTLKLDTGSRSDIPDYAGPQTVTVDITPRRLQRLLHFPHTQFYWKNTAIGEAIPIQSGTVEADEDGLFTIEGFSVSPQGNELGIIVTDSGIIKTQKRGAIIEMFDMDINPNPFNPHTVITIKSRGSDRCPANEFINQHYGTVQIHDIKGNLVEKLEATRTIAHDFTEYDWNASKYASGIYVIVARNRNGKIIKYASLVK